MIHRKTGRISQGAIVYAVIFTCALSGSLAMAASPRNVVFIISDDLSAEVLSCYGSPQCETPHIDALARRGLKLNHAYCQYPVCGPSRAALMSGMYPQAIGVTGNGSSDRFSENIGTRLTMSGLFKAHHYYTARVSKIFHMRVPGDITAGVDGPDHADSWTERFNCKGPEWMTEGEHSHWSNEKLKRTPNKHYSLGFGSAFYVVKGGSDGAEQPDVQAANKAIELLERHRHESFFLAVGLVRPHVPLVAPATFFESYPSGEMQLVPTTEGDWDDIPKMGISKNSQSTGLADAPNKQREVLSAYYASVAFMDAQVGRITKALDRLNLRESTVVVFTSDHGYHLGEHSFWQKMSLHEESTRIPLIFSVPGMPAVESNSLAQQIDIYPSLAELCGLNIPSHCQGKSLARLFNHPDSEVHDAVYCLKSGGHLIRTKRWAYIEYRDGSCELYDMKNDPRQFTNLAIDDGYSRERQDMKQLLAKKLAAIVP